MSEREHFASSFGNWLASTPEGSATLTVNDSRALLTLSGGVAPQSAFLYRAFQHASDHIFATCVRNDTNASLGLFVLHKATAPVGDIGTNIDAMEAFGVRFMTATTRRPRVHYWNAAGVQQFWDDATLAWTTSTTVGSIPSGQNDSSLILGYQWDVTNQRVRLFVIGAGSGTTKIEACGPKLFCLTDWIAFSGMRNSGSSTLWLALGKPANQVAQTGASQVEWTRIETGTKRFAAANQANVTAGAYSIKLWEGYGQSPAEGGGSAARFWLASGAAPRTSLICGPGTQPWCSVQTQMAAGIRENDATLWCFFTGRSAQYSSVGVTKSTDGGNTWTPYASNPIVAQVTGTNLQNCGNVSVVKDMQEPDAAKRYKLFLSFSDTAGNWRIYLYTASAPESTWTQQGVLAAPDAASPTGYRLNANPIYHNGEWLLIHDNWIWRGPALNIASLTKQALGVNLGGSGVSQAATVLSSTSRIFSVASSTGFVQDAMVQLDDSPDGSIWAINRIRKNLNATQAELYELTPGYAAGAVIQRYDVANVSLHGVYRDPQSSEWCWYITFFGFGNSLQTTGLAVSSSPLVVPTIDWFDTPQVWLARNGNTGTSENMKFFDPPVTPAAGGAPSDLTMYYRVKRARDDRYHWRCKP